MAFFCIYMVCPCAEIIIKNCFKIVVKFYKSILYKISRKFYSNFPQSDTLFGR